MRRNLIIGLAIGLIGGSGLIAPTVAAAQDVRFDGNWSEQRFALFSRNAYDQRGQSLGVTSNGTVSLLWTALPDAMWQGTRAGWNWTVEQSVPATDLTLKGGDDRNLSLYFVFLPQDAAIAARGAGIRTLLDNAQARVLMYVWGGDHARGEVLPSPYLGDRGRSVILRPAGTGSASESVDLVADHRRAFGSDPAALVGLAVSADSDDTRSSILAVIEGLRID